MQSSDRNVFNESQSRADSAFHMLRTVSSTDTCQLAFLNRRSLVRRTQESARALVADEAGGLAVEEHRTAADEDGNHGGVVAVDHSGQTAVLLDAVLGVVIESRV